MPVVHIKDGSHLASMLTEAENKLCVLDFGAAWCQPCQRMSPEFDRLSAIFPGIKFMKIDVDECGEVSEEYKVRSLPTFLFIRRSKEVDRFVGASIDTLVKTLAKHGGGCHEVLFTGIGKKLVPGPETTTNTFSLSSRCDEECEAQAREAFPLDVNGAISKIHVRLPDGKLLIVHLNSSATVGTLRDYIAIARPGISNVPFVLSTIRPNKELIDESVTILEANLANSVLIVKLNNNSK